ncbi:MAG: hypothetical protein OIF55_15935 [Amphritea sp.]|nr:hypothetical protein [Amphritea sp.]
MYRRASFLLVLLLSLTPLAGSAMQLQDPRSAAVFIQKQRPLVTACLEHSHSVLSTDQLWSYPACATLLERDQQIRQAWSLLLPDGSARGLVYIPYGLRQPTVDAYSEYKKLAQRIARLTP